MKDEDPEFVIPVGHSTFNNLFRRLDVGGGRI